MKYFCKCKCFIINIIHVWCINASSRREHFKFEPFVYTILSIKYVQTKPYMYKKTSFTDLGCESLSYTWMILSSKCSVKKFKLTIAGSYNINSALARYNVFQNNQHNSSLWKMCRRVMLESTTILSVTTYPWQKGFFPLTGLLLYLNRTWSANYDYFVRFLVACHYVSISILCYN